MKLSQLDERFEAEADLLTYTVGKWWFTTLSFVLLVCWVLYGALVLAPRVPGWFTSAQWNFPLNTITTVGEWFCEGLILAAANRVQRRADASSRHLQEVVDGVDRIVEQLAAASAEQLRHSTAAEEMLSDFGARLAATDSRADAP